jgi:hypothetical protein
MASLADEKGEAFSMSETFLSNFMHVTFQITGAERALVVDRDLKIIDMLNLEQSDVLADNFIGIDVIQRSLNTGESIVTNNAVADMSSAPNTNTNFSNLRLIVVIPAAGNGAVYLDQLMRKGVIPKDMVNRLMALGEHIAQSGQLEISADEMANLYQQIA